MTDATDKLPKRMPKGTRKGGTRYPRYSLSDSLGWSKKLVSKTHLGPQPQDVIYSGVVGAKSGIGDIKISTLKQYGLLEGASSAYSASDLAKQINSAPVDEVLALYRKAVLNPYVFKSLFDTFHGDAVTRAKLKQRIADLEVHPDETESCVEIYTSSMVTAQLISVEGDKISHISSQEMVASSDGLVGELLKDKSDETDENLKDGDNKKIKDPLLHELGSRAPRAVFNVNVTLDSSLDIEKLAKQLDLLKRYGAI